MERNPKTGRFLPKPFTVELSACNRGRNKRGTCLHKRTKRARPTKFRESFPPRPVRSTSYELSR